MPAGDIGAVVDTLEFDGINCLNPCLLHISGTVYVIAYTGNNSYGTIATVNIADDGTLGAAAIDSYIFLAAACAQPKIVHVSGNVFAICYGGLDGDGFVSTVAIATNGTITKVIIDTIEYDLIVGINADIINVSGSIFAMACPGNLNRGWLHTIKINANGTIDDAVLDSLQFTAATGLYPNLIHIFGNIFAIAFTGVDNDGFVVTVSIDDAGAIGGAVIDSLEFDIGYGANPRITHVSGSIFAIAYNGVDNDGFVVTVSIGTAGSIGGAVIDSLEFDTGTCFTPVIVNVSGSIFAIAYNGVDVDGFIVTIKINADGTIDDAVIDSFEFDIVQGVQPSLVCVAGSIFAIAYQGPFTDGFLITLGIEGGPVGKTHHMMIMGID